MSAKGISILGWLGLGLCVRSCKDYGHSRDLGFCWFAGPLAEFVGEGGGLIEAADEYCFSATIPYQPFGITHGPGKRVIAMGVGDVVAMTIGADGNGRTEGVMGALHKERGLQELFVVVDDVVEELLATFEHTA